MDRGKPKSAKEKAKEEKEKKKREKKHIGDDMVTSFLQDPLTTILYGTGHA